jgi:hypothetical protein
MSYVRRRGGLVPSAQETERKKLLKAFLAPDPNDGEEDEMTYEPLPEAAYLSWSILRTFDRSKGGLAKGMTRLIRLLPGKDFEPIEAQMSICEGDDEYEALSYCWGDPKDSLSPITCNGS